MNKQKLTLVSLFSGAGGMDLGFEKAGFHTIWANEYDKTIAPSYKNYFTKAQFHGESITEIPNNTLPRGVTGVIGGPPCQSWSAAGAKRGIKDPRGQLFFEYLRVINQIQPAFFVAENVHGLIHPRNLKAFDKIIKLFKAAGYNISWKLLNASDYGVPQDRERIFIVGYRSTLNKTFQFPAPIKPKLTLRDAIGDLVTVNFNDIKNHEFKDAGYSPMFLSRNRVRGWDEQSYTILATDRHIPFHPQAPKMIKIPSKDAFDFAKGERDKYRRLTVRECARIQTFPDEYEFIYKNIRNGYKMIGNAVPVNLAYHIAKVIRKDLIAVCATQINATSMNCRIPIGIDR